MADFFGFDGGHDVMDKYQSHNHHNQKPFLKKKGDHNQKESNCQNSGKILPGPDLERPGQGLPLQQSF